MMNWQPSSPRIGPARPPWSFRVACAILALAALQVAAARPLTAFESAAPQALLVDATTGVTLFAKNADEPMPPASMSKVMTVFMAFQALSEGRLALDDTFTVSENAWRKGGAASGGSTMFLDVGSEVTVEELLRGIIVQSGNDASIVLAEGLSGSEEAFARDMTRVGRDIGLTSTTFTNAAGLPDPGHLTTARDLATLAIETIRRFPAYYHYYAETEYTHNGIRQGNRNPLLYKNIGADGLKTGHTEASGYGLTASAVQDGRRLVLVINGLESIRQRTAEAERLMAWGFREFENYTLLAAGATLEEADVWLGATDTVPLTSETDLVVTLPRDARDSMAAVVRYDGPVPAPIARGAAIATLEVSAEGVEPMRFPLVAGADVEKLGVLGRLFAVVEHLVMHQLQ